MINNSVVVEVNKNSKLAQIKSKITQKVGNEFFEKVYKFLQKNKQNHIEDEKVSSLDLPNRLEGIREGTSIHYISDRPISFYGK